MAFVEGDPITDKSTEFWNTYSLVLSPLREIYSCIRGSLSILTDAIQ